MLYLVHCLVFALTTIVNAQDLRTLLIDNGVQGQPKIECHADHLSLDLVTQKPFQGHIFVKGHYKDDDCRKDYYSNPEHGAFLALDFSKCGLRRQRMAQPRGLQLSTTVVVSFHHKFITQIDKAYKIECFYREDDQKVTANLEVSMIPTIDLDSNPPMPTCNYRVLHGGPNGTPVRFARVGDRVYHKWHCEYPMDDMYCMLIHSCTVDDGEGAAHEIVDANGCSKDKVILDELEYAADLLAGTETQVFKFADKAHLHFECRITLSLKNEHNGVCPKPECGFHNILRGRRIQRRAAKRDISKVTDHEVVSFDLLAQPVLVLDFEEGDEYEPPNDTLARQNAQLAAVLPNFAKPNFPETGICLSEVAFGSFLGAIAVAMTTAILLSGLVCYKLRTSKS